MDSFVNSIRWPVTLVGAFLMNLPCGLPLFIGNLSVYYLSYISVNLHDEGAKVSPWVMSIFDLAQAVGTVIAGVLPQYIGNRWTLISGTGIMAVGFISCYYAVQISPVLLMVTLAVLPGIGAGISRLMALTILYTWSQESKGFFASVPPTAFGIGSIIINQFLTRYVNPNGLVPVKFTEKDTYFNQPNILQRVPFAFIYVGLFSLGAQLIGTFLLNEKVVSNVETESSQLVTDEKSSRIRMSTDAGNDKENDCDEKSTVCNRTTPLYSSKQTEPPEGKESRAKKIFNPKWLLSNVLFYVFLLLFVSSKQEGLVFYTYYKLFGQTWIRNDYFLTNMGTVISFTVMLARPLWGLIVDKIGVKPVTVLIFMVGGALYCWIYVSKYFSEWMYVVACITVATVHCACIIIFPVLVSEYFGKENFAKNFGFLLMVEASLNIATPLWITVILQNFGWFVLFAYIGAFIVISAIGSLLLIPNIAISK